MNKIIFGGSFDPIHNGHINMAKIASKELNAEVIFVPARISVWKEISAPIEDKINMIKLSIEGETMFHIDTFEMNSGKDINYSIDTVRYFKDKFPDDEIYYLIGGDHVNAFHNWKDPEELSSLAHIIFFARPGIELDKNNVEKYHMKEIVGPMIDVSASSIRELKKLDVPVSVLKYIEEHNLYYIPLVKDYMSEKRFNHCKEVAHLAYRIAKLGNDVDPYKAYVTGLLHDIAKEQPLGIQEKVMEVYFDKYLKYPKFAYHQFMGSFLMKVIFNITDESMINAVMFHATGYVGMDKLGKLIYACDKIDPTRGYDSSELIKAMENDIDEGFNVVLKANLEFYKSKGYEIYPTTMELANKYLK